MVRSRWVLATLTAALLALAAVPEGAEAQHCRRSRGDRDGDCRPDRRRDRDEDRDRQRGGGGVEFGVRGGYDFEEDTGLAGAQLRVPLAYQLLVSPSFDVFFEDSRTEWQANADLVLRPAGLAGVYGGIGAAFLNGDFDGSGDGETEAGFNVLLGLDGGRVGGSTVRPFAEGRWTNVEDYDAFRLALGFNVPVSGRLW